RASFGNPGDGVGGVGGRGGERTLPAVGDGQRVHVEDARLVGGEQELAVVRRPRVAAGQPVGGGRIEGLGSVALHGRRLLCGRFGAAGRLVTARRAGSPQGGGSNERKAGAGHRFW